jgi:hypothetical protein
MAAATPNANLERLPDSYSFAEFIALAIPHMDRLISGFHEPCQFILSLGTGSGKYSRGLLPILGANIWQPIVIVAIDAKFINNSSRSRFKELLTAYKRITFYFIHDPIPTTYPEKTLKLRLRTYKPHDLDKHKKILFGFADLCVPREDYPLNPLIPILQNTLDAGGKIIVQNEIYFMATSAVEHNDSYYSLNSLYKGDYPIIYSELNSKILPIAVTLV